MHSELIPEKKDWGKKIEKKRLRKNHQCSESFYWFDYNVDKKKIMITTYSVNRLNDYIVLKLIYFIQ